jgi:hypothetical protein
MQDIDVHSKNRESASKLRAPHLPKPSKILDSLLSCVFFGVRMIYRERLHRAHPASQASLADFRAFVRAILVEWSDTAMVDFGDPQVSFVNVSLFADMNLHVRSLILERVA